MIHESMLYLNQQSLNDQQVHIKKKNLRMLIVFLSASANFGNAFCGNSAAPLQREIQSEMEIKDTQFNLLFSVRSVFTLFLPFFLGQIVDRFGIKKCLLTLCGFCALGQMLFAIGLSAHNYNYLLIGRLIFGISDLVTVFQQTILCFWFDSHMLPFVFGMLLFMCKVVRAINDNTASMFYNATGSLSLYFWVGFGVCLGSLISAYYLTTIHESVSENIIHCSLSKEKEEEKKEMLKKDQQSSELNSKVRAEQYSDKKSESIWTTSYINVMGIYMCGFACVHSFYPNLSNLLQTRFGFSNEEAGHIASLPYILASFATPLFGSLISKLGDKMYEQLLFISMAIIFITQMNFILISDSVIIDPTVDPEPNNFAIFPVGLFGIAHALFVTLQGPLINKTIRDKTALPKAFSIMKVAENIGAMTFTFLAGYIRVKTESFMGVHILFAFITLIGCVVGYNYQYKLAKDEENLKNKILKDNGSLDKDEDIKELQTQKQLAPQNYDIELQQISDTDPSQNSSITNISSEEPLEQQDVSVNSPSESQECINISQELQNKRDDEESQSLIDQSNN
eukprot:403341886